MQPCPTIVIAESNRHDFETVTQLVRSIFSNEPGYTLIQATNEDELFSSLNKNSVCTLILDLHFPEPDKTVALFRRLQKQYLQTIIIPVIPPGNKDLIKRILQLDTFFYIKKPYDPEEIRIALKKAHEKISYSPVLLDISSPAEQTNFYGIIGKTPSMIRLFDLITKIAEDDFSNVLIRGESGTGKELVAKAIHFHSKRRNNNFVPVNCAAIPEDLLESELFGHTRGAFTGAVQNKIGRIQYADGGTLFLDEIGDMKISLQAKLLRVLQEKEFEPVGALKAIPVDTRVLAATHCDLEQLVKEGRFREDLYYRLSVIPLNIPSLINRKEDIPLLLDFFTDIYTRKRGRKPIVFSKRAVSILMNFQWRGNVRELENLVQHMSILYSGKKIEVNDLPEKFLSPANNPENRTDDEIAPHTDSRILDRVFPNPLKISSPEWNNGRIDFNELVNNFETQLIVQAMKISSGNKKEAARLLNLKRTTLLEKIKKKELAGLWEDTQENGHSK